MSTKTQPCPLCGAQSCGVRYDADQMSAYECPCCGHYVAYDQDFESEAVPESYYRLSHFLRQRYERTGKQYTLRDRGEDGRFPQDLSELPMSEKLDLALLWLADNSRGFGSPASFSVQADWPVAQARDAQEFSRIIGHWRDEGMLDNSKPPDFSLTAKGWSRVEEIRPHTPERSRQAFVAMWFDPALDKAYESGLRPALEGTGWKPWRADRSFYEEKICDRVIAEIRRSGLMVVECAGQRPSVYFEAGFAMGLGIPIIWCARKAEFDDAGVAFDTRQYPHLVWDSVNELKDKIVDRVRALHAKSA